MFNNAIMYTTKHYVAAYTAWSLIKTKRTVTGETLILCTVILLSVWVNSNLTTLLLCDK